MESFGNLPKIYNQVAKEINKQLTLAGVQRDLYMVTRISGRYRCSPVEVFWAAIRQDVLDPIKNSVQRG